MGFNNPGVPWSELERRLSGGREPARGDPAFPGDGGDSPAWSRRRQGYEAPDLPRRRGSTPYAELHCHSNFSFLDGASHPEELVEEAARLGLEALAITDHDGFYGVVRFAEAARELGMPTVFGVELTLQPPSTAAATQVRRLKPEESRVLPDPHPDHHHLVVLARDPHGYARLGDLISRSQMAGEKGAPKLTFDQFAQEASGAARDHWVVLTGCRKGTVNRALVEGGPAAAERELLRLVDAAGGHNVLVELWDHGHPLDSARNDALVQVALKVGVEPVATNNAHYATPARRPLATALAAVRARRSLDEIDPWLPGAAAAHLRSGAEQGRRFARYPGVVERAAQVGAECAFDLALVAPQLPPFPCPPRHTEMSWLRELTEQGAVRRYGTRGAERVRGAYAQIDRELALIEQLGFPGYFLVVWDLVDFCHRSGIYCQGRGSAANSAVCYALGITNADAVDLGLLFERFLSPERDGPPDIDIDIESGRREEVIQYVYATHGRTHTAQVANVITYRAKSAVRDMAKAMGFATGQQDAWSKEVDRWGPVRATADDTTSTIPSHVMEMAMQVEGFPRHLGIHSGGMVICDRPVVEVCPVEWGRMEGRSVLQWDKDDCAAVGLVKFDLLGLGMLSALHHAVDLVAEHHGVDVDLAVLAQEPQVYEMLCRADSIGVFQVESRAQMATLPRLRPRTFYDLVVEVALIRPGPIQGGSVHPYIRRRNGEEPVTFLHPLMERALAKTLGVPLFQEQLMQLAIDVAGFTPSEADQLRQAMGSKRSRERMERLRLRLYEGMAERGITGAVADEIFDKLAAFANYGFPESHSVSFAYLVYASSWLKFHFPAAFCAALLKAQPMGFYSPHSLVQDARRHGVEVHTPDINRSDWEATLEPRGGLQATPGAPPWGSPPSGSPPSGSPPWGSTPWGSPPSDSPPSDSPEPEPEFGVPRCSGEVTVRLGIGSVRHVGEDLAKRIAAGRPYSSMEDLVRRADVPLPALEALATAGALDSLGGQPRATARRKALWQVGAVAQSKPDRLEGIITGGHAPQLPGMTDAEMARSDLWATGVSPDGHPTRFIRADLERLGVVTATGLAAVDAGSKVLVGGVVTHRQRPATAGGTMFINLEDETGLVNVVCSLGCWTRHRTVARSAPALMVRGRLERAEGVTNVIAEVIHPLPVSSVLRSRDFR